MDKASYEILVDTDGVPEQTKQSYVSSTTNSNPTITNYVGTGTSDYWNITYPYSYYWNTTVYMYQLSCPRCKKTNWGQLETVVNCTRCKATLKAVSKKVDYEIPIT